MAYNQLFCDLPSRMAGTKITRADSNEEIGARLTLLRLAYSRVQKHVPPLNDSEFARLCDIGIQAWHNAKQGHQRMGLDNAMRVRARTGADLEFIYFGVRTHLPHAIAVAIEQIDNPQKPRVKRAS
jgi:hypothetical protein